MTPSTATSDDPGQSTTAELSLAEQLSLWALRVWVGRRLENLEPCPGFHRAFALAGAPQAAAHLADFLAVLAVEAKRPIEVNCPKCPKVTPDEATLLAALSAAQQGPHGLASDLLGRLMDEGAARQAMPDLWRFGRALLIAGLRLPWRPDAKLDAPRQLAAASRSHCPDRGLALTH